MTSRSTGDTGFLVSKLQKEIRGSERSWDTNFQLLDGVRESLEGMGVPNVAASRIGGYQRAFHALRDAASMTDYSVEDGARLLGSMTDFHQLRRIVAAAERSDQQDAWIRQLKQLPGGAAFLEAPDARPDGRDIQFECFVAAVLELSGLAVAFEEPDLLLTAGGQTVAIAAKRPRSRRSILKNLQRGISQVRRSGSPGLVALDLSTALHHGDCINTNDVRGGALLLREATDSAVAELIPRVRSNAQSSDVFGILGHLMLPVLNFGHPQGTQVATAVRWTVGHTFNDPGGWLDWVNDVGDRCDAGLYLPLEGDSPGMGHQG